MIPQNQNIINQRQSLFLKVQMHNKRRNINNFVPNNYYNAPNTNSFSMILSSVLVGVYEIGNAEMKDPPIRNDGSNKQYDSTVDCLMNPSIFVIYKDYRAYPTYIINYT
jgi:poly [ADP-ribose] polymerase 10/14/15